MFEADGRNSIQTLGHGAVQVVKVFLGVVFLVTILPVLFTIYMWQTMRLQQGALEAIAKDPSVTAILVDFNVATARPKDFQAWMGWNGNPEAKGIDPSLQCLPFQVTYLYDQHPGGPMCWTPRQLPGDNAWIYYNLPFEDDLTLDFGFNRAFDEWIYDPARRTVDPFKLDTLAFKMAEEWNSRAKYCIPKDPWYLQGFGKMAPTRYWDWHSGLQLAQAKASYNYRAYVGAARAVYRMRLLVAQSRVNGVLPRGDDTSAEAFKPMLGVRETPVSRRPQFYQTYNHAFEGKLPKMLLLTQNLGDKALLHDPRFQDYQKANGEKGWSMMVKVWAVSEGPFIVGMTPWDGYHPYDRGALSMKFTYGDILYRSTPSIEPQARQAQATLTRMQTFAFWKPLLTAEGITNPRTLELAQELLQRSSQKTSKDIKLARRFGHVIYHHQED